MQKLAKLTLLFVFLFSVAVAASAQESDQNFNKELVQETPQQQKQEAERPDTKASAGDLAKATQNPVASLINVPLQNVTDFNIGSFGRDRNTVLQHAIGFSARERRRAGLRKCQAFGQFTVPDVAVEIPSCILVSPKTQRVVRSLNWTGLPWCRLSSEKE
jgi:hypothetical protein